MGVLCIIIGSLSYNIKHLEVSVLVIRHFFLLLF